MLACDDCLLAFIYCLFFLMLHVSFILGLLPDGLLYSGISFPLFPRGSLLTVSIPSFVGN